VATAEKIAPTGPFGFRQLLQRDDGCRTVTQQHGRTRRAGRRSA
jgi:hypothetical protein